MPELKDLKAVRDEIRSTFETFKELNDKAINEAEKRGGEATAETREKVDKINSDLTDLKKQIVDFEKRMKSPGNAPDEKGGESSESEFRKAAYAKYLRYGMGEGAAVDITPDERRALAGTSDSDGNFLAPSDFEKTIIMNAYDMAEIRPLCQVGTTSRDSVKMGILSKPIVGWGGRGLEVDKQTLSTGGITIPIRNVRALALISNDTLDDADANIMQELSSGYERAVAEAEDDAFAVGSDADAPNGILVSAAVQSNNIVSGVADDISSATINGMNAIKDIYFGLKKTYRRNGTFAMTSLTESAYRKLTDGEGRYLWDAKEMTLLGKKVINPEGMPEIAAGAYAVLFGDFKAGYKIRDRSGLVIQRLTERYAEYDQTGFMLKKRVGAAVTLPEAFYCLKIAAS